MIHFKNITDAAALELLKQVPSDSIIGFSVQLAIERGRSINKILGELISQAHDNPPLVRGVLTPHVYDQLFTDLNVSISI